MQINKSDKNKCGIYCIINTKNNKKYIGKSKNIQQRMQQHRYNLNKSSKNENRHLIAAWNKYGEDAFIYNIIEELPLEEKLLQERELYWIEFYDTTNRKKGYNLRKDSSTKMIVHPETLERYKIAQRGEKNGNYGHKWTDKQKYQASQKFKKMYQDKILIPNLIATQKAIISRNNNWEKQPKLKEQMKKKISVKNTTYKFYQYTKNGDLIQIWNSVYDILKAHPEYKRHNIYAACSGYKPTIYGYIWKKINNDIVQI